MQIAIDSELLIGLCAAFVLAGALAASPLFRNIAFAGAAAGTCAVYAQRGVEGIVALARSIAADVGMHDQFAIGLGLGALVAATTLTVVRLRRPV